MKLIPLTKGRFAIVDDEDYEKLIQFKWHSMIAMSSREYAVRRIVIDGKRTAMCMHREIIEAKKGDEVDHINGDGLDNRKSNLRLCTHQQNISNRKVNKNSKSGYKGVLLMVDKKRLKPWRSHITSKGIRTNIGMYATKEEAARAYNKKAVELFGSFARLNHIV